MSGYIAEFEVWTNYLVLDSKGWTSWDLNLDFNIYWKAIEITDIVSSNYKLDFCMCEMASLCQGREKIPEGTQGIIDYRV